MFCVSLFFSILNEIFDNYSEKRLVENLMLEMGDLLEMIRFYQLS